MRLKNRIVCVFCLIISSGHSTPGAHNNIELYCIGERTNRYPKIKIPTAMTSSNAMPIAVFLPLNATKAPAPIITYTRSNNIEKLI